jgi:hypothetical protein
MILICFLFLYYQLLNFIDYHRLTIIDKAWWKYDKYASLGPVNLMFTALLDLSNMIYVIILSPLISSHAYAIFYWPPSWSCLNILIMLLSVSFCTNSSADNLWSSTYCFFMDSGLETICLYSSKSISEALGLIAIVKLQGILKIKASSITLRAQSIW